MTNQTENKIAYINVNVYPDRRTTFDLSGGEDTGSWCVDVMLGHNDAIALMGVTLDMIPNFTEENMEIVKNMILGVAKEKGWI